MAEIRTIFDEMCKALVTTVLETVTTVTAEKSVSSQPQRIDVAFEAPAHPIGPEAGLGLLGWMIMQGPGMIEYFLKAPPLSELDACIRKQLNHHHERELKAQRNQQPRPEKPFLWVITAARPLSALEAYEVRAVDGWPSGAWWPRRVDRTCFMVVPDLPADRESLILRLLGSTDAQDQATDELLSLPDLAPVRHLLSSSMVTFRKRIAQHRQHGEELDMEMLKFFKNADRIAAQELGKARKEGIKEGIKEGRKEGIQEGREQGERAILLRLLARRFGELPAEVTERIERAHTAQLERWSERVLDARSLDEVFGRARRASGANRTGRE